MDDYTQNLLERTRQRRELLAKKMAETSPTAAPRKRRTPLSEDNSENIATENTHINNDDSPKRTCLREEEQNIKADTPAIVGVKSRVHLLSTEHKGMDITEADKGTTPVPAPRNTKENSTPADPASRKTRLAMLAQTINNWEDDLDHPRYNRQAKNEKPARVWQPPKPEGVDTTPTKPPRYKKMEWEHNKPAAAAETSSFKSAALGRCSPSKAGAAVASNKHTPSRFISPSPSPTRKYDENTKAPANVDRNSVKKLTDLLETANKPASDAASSKKPMSARISAWQNKDAISKEGSEQQSVKPLQSHFNKHTSQSAAGFKAFSKTATNLSSAAVQQKSSDLNVSVNEPTAQPVKSRLATWKQRDQSDASKDNNKEPSSTSNTKPFPLSSTRVLASPKSATHVTLAGPPPPKPPRMEDRPSPAKSPLKSPLKSPAKVSSSISNMQKHLFAADSTWKNNTIAEKISQQKQEDMNVLQDRWKRGVLKTEPTCEGSGRLEIENVKAVSPVKITTTPVHPAASLIKAHNSGPSKNPVMSGKRQEARQRMRQDDDQNIKTSDEHNFENKLSTMGFDIKSDSELGHVATIQLKKKNKDSETRGKSPAKPCPEKGKSPTTKMATYSPNKRIHVETEHREDTSVVHVDQKTLPKSYMPMEKDESFRNFQSPTVGKLFNKMQSRSGPTSDTVKPVTKGTSIYNLIKKNKTGEVSTGGNSEANRLNLGYSSSSSAGDNNQGFQGLKYAQNPSYSFESSFSEDEERPELESSQDDVNTTEDNWSSCGETHDDEDVTGSQADDDDEYQAGHRHADYTTEFDTDCTDCREGESDDRYNYTESEVETAADETQSEDEECSDDEDAESDESCESGINELLDEAMDETQCEVTTAGLFSKTAAAPQKVTFKESYDREAMMAASSSESVNSNSTDDKTIMYSIDMYRRSGNKRNAPPPMMTIVRHSQHTDYQEEEEPMPYIPEKNAKDRIKELQDLVNKEQSVIMQTSNALNKCCGKDSSFAGSKEQVECNRLLLLSCKKREAYLEQIQKLRDGRVQCRENAAKGSLTISDIRLPLKRDFLNRRGTIQDNAEHFFLCMIRHQAHVIVTQMIGTHQGNVRSSLEFPNLIKLNDIPQNFKLELEIYGMSVTKESQTPQSKKSKHCKLTPKKFFSLKSGGGHLQSPGGPHVVRTTNFVLVSSLSITRDTLNRGQFSLGRVVASSPLAGHVLLKQKCIMESQVREKGFLTMFEDVSGFGAWHRRWTVLKDNLLSFWKYPDDEFRKEPMGVIDLKRCITNVVGLIPRDICARPNTVEITTVRPQQDGEQDTLVSRSYKTITTIKHMLSADTKEDRILWCDKINEALRNVRTWHSDAMRPIQSMV